MDASIQDSIANLNMSMANINATLNDASSNLESLGQAMNFTNSTLQDIVSNVISLNEDISTFNVKNNNQYKFPLSLVYHIQTLSIVFFR